MTSLLGDRQRGSYRGFYRIVAYGMFCILFNLAATFFLLEMCVRAFFSIQVSPDAFLWGTVWYRRNFQQLHLRGQNVFEHQNDKTGYSKYFPYQKRLDVSPSGESFEVTINNYGFRGRDYKLEKDVGTFRVLTLGGSSTFGFSNRDFETYPHYLEQELNQRLVLSSCKRYQRAEVINLGVPHLNTEQVAALFAAEGVALQPDAVTLYSAYNNTLGLGVRPWVRLLSKYSLFVNTVRILLQRNLRLDAESLARESVPRITHYLSGLKKITELARAQTIPLFLITQQARSLPADVIFENQYTYGDEIELLTQRVSRQEREISSLEGKFLVHAELNAALRRFAMREEIALIDGLAALNTRRNLLTSYVHLSPAANRILAAAIAKAFEARFPCIAEEPHHSLGG